MERSLHLWKGPDPVLIWGQGHIYVFSQEENEVQWLSESSVQFVEQKHTNPDDTVAAETFPEELK